MPGEHTSLIDNDSAIETYHSHNEDETHSGGKRSLILVIDERPDICEMLCQALTMAGFYVTSYTGGATWIDWAIQCEDTSALVLLDLSTSVREATAFLMNLRMQWKAAPPILIMTTSKYMYNELASAERIILKPFHIRNLLDEIQEIIQ